MADPLHRTVWRETLADPGILSAIRHAVRECTSDGCGGEHRNVNGEPTDDPDYCDCRENVMTPIELYHWLEREVMIAQRQPVRMESGYKPDKRNNRNLSLAVA